MDALVEYLWSLWPFALGVAGLVVGWLFGIAGNVVSDRIKLWLDRRRRIKELEKRYTKGELEALIEAARKNDPLWILALAERPVGGKRNVYIKADGKDRRFLEKTSENELKGLAKRDVFEETAGGKKFWLTEKGAELGEELLHLFE